MLKCHCVDFLNSKFCISVSSTATSSLRFLEDTWQPSEEMMDEAGYMMDEGGYLMDEA